MANKFNIHDWQADQVRKKLDEQFTPDLEKDALQRDKVQQMIGKERGASQKPEGELESEISKYIGQTFASWMSPDSPPFAQEYAKPPYIDKLVGGIMEVINDYEGEESETDNTVDSPGASAYTVDMGPGAPSTMENTTGGGASFNAGNSMGHFGKKKKKH